MILDHHLDDFLCPGLKSQNWKRVRLICHHIACLSPKIPPWWHAILYQTQRFHSQNLKQFNNTVLGVTSRQMNTIPFAIFFIFYWNIIKNFYMKLIKCYTVCYNHSHSNLWCQPFNDRKITFWQMNALLTSLLMWRYIWSSMNICICS